MGNNPCGEKDDIPPGDNNIAEIQTVQATLPRNNRTFDLGIIKEEDSEIDEVPNYQGNSWYIYIENGGENLSNLPKHKIDLLDKIAKKISKKNSEFKFFLCTKDQKYVFAISKNQLLQFNLRNMNVICNHGKIYHNFDELLILKNPLAKRDRATICKFKKFEDNRSTEQTYHNETIKKIAFIPKLLLGEYYVTDQNFGNYKGSVIFTVNEVQ